MVNKELINIIIPCLNEQENVIKLAEQIVDKTKGLNYNFQLIFVDDGSTDNTWQNIQNLPFDNISGIKLYIPEFISKWEEGSKIIVAKRTSRQENLFRRIVFALFFYIQSKLTDIDIPKNTGHFSFLDKEVVKQLQNFPESVNYINGNRSYVGYQTDFIDVVKKDRMFGKPKMTFLKLFNLGINAIFNFSSKPLTLIGFLGFLVSFGSILFSIFALYFKLKYGRTLLGWNFGLSSIYFLSGIQLLSLSIIGKYVNTIFQEVKKRPEYIVESKI
jgi:dolichol-phosphate mannosyltransferase